MAKNQQNDIEYYGEIIKISELSERTGIGKSTLYYRHQRGLRGEALWAKVQQKKQSQIKDLIGELPSREDLDNEELERRVAGYLKKGWSPEEIVIKLRLL